MAREGTKTARAIAVMVANKDKPMDEVLPLIAEATGHDIPHARNYYLWCVRKGVAPGTIPTATKTKRVPAQKLLKDVGVKVSKTKAPKAAPKAVKETPKSTEELAAIKAANVARLKDIHEKFQAKNKIDPRRMNIPKNVDVEDVTEDEIQERLAKINDEADSFTAPKFLRKADLKAMGV